MKTGLDLQLHEVSKSGTDLPAVDLCLPIGRISALCVGVLTCTNNAYASWQAKSRLKYS